MTELNTHFRYPTLDGLDVAGKRVILRADYNIPEAPGGALLDDWRITASIPTVKRLLKNGARLGILTHRGRPQGRVAPELSVAPIAKALEEKLGQHVEFVPDCVGRIAEQTMKRLEPGQVALFENTRFHHGEHLNQMDFTRRLCELGDIFVNDAFACIHRAHASTSGLAAAMPVSVIGDLMVQELRWLSRMQENPERPLLLILGGDDVAVKLDLISHLMTSVDTLMLGGTIGLTFLMARDVGLGQSMVEHSCVEACRQMLAEAGVVGCRLHLPKDLIVAKKDDLPTPVGIRDIHEIGDDEVASDLGPQTMQVWERLVEESSSVVWIGSLGDYAYPAFRKANLQLGKMLADKKGFSLIGGNRLVRTMAEGDLRARLPAVSTGVGALVAALSGQTLPALAVLKMRMSNDGKGWERRRSLS